MITAGLPIHIAFLVAVAFIWVMIIYQVVMTVAGFVHRLRSARRTADLLSRGGPLPPVSILIPARNEEVVIEQTLEAIRGLRYPGGTLEIIVVDDGSTDRTGEIVEGISALDPRVKLLRLPRQEQGRGKSHALNTALRSVSHGIVAVYDADNRPEPESLEILVRRLESGEKLAAVLGKFRTLNKDKNLLTRFINLETLGFQWIVQAGRCALFGVGILPGTNFVIRRSVLDECDGWDEKAITEDTELSIRVYERGWKIDFAPEAVTWEEEPEKFKVWVKQRTRWVRGNFYVLRKFLLPAWSFQNKFLALQLLYLSVLYYLFLFSVIVSHGVFLTCATGLLRVDVPGPYNLVWLSAFLLFVAELYLVCSYEGEHGPKQVGIACLMYITYCQGWLIVVFRALWHEYILKEGHRWDKTVRFGTPPPGEPKAASASIAEAGIASAGIGGAESPAEGQDGAALAAPEPRRVRGGLLRSLLRLAGLGCSIVLLSRIPPARADTLLEAARGEEPFLNSLWGEIYLESSFETSQDDNLIGYVDVKTGLRLVRLGDAVLSLYEKGRAYKDTNDDFWNNKAVVGPGLRLRPLPELGLYVFAEYLFGRYYGIEGENPNPYPESFKGVEAGLAFWQRWGTLPEETRFFLPLACWREAYWDAIYFQRDDDNFIQTFTGKEGFGALRLGPVAVDFYLRANGAIDANKDYWNNYVEGGAGLRLRPISEELDLRLSCEVVGGYYIDRDGRYELPYDREYVGLRVELTFWFGWEGRKEFQNEE